MSKSLDIRRRRMSEGYPPDWDSRRRSVYQRDNYQCQNCGAQGGPHGNAELHAHHVVPKSKGGTHQLNNLTTMCSTCHDAIHNQNDVSPTNPQIEQSVSQSRDDEMSDIEWFFLQMQIIFSLDESPVSEKNISVFILLPELMRIMNESGVEIIEIQSYGDTPPEQLFRRYEYSISILEDLLLSEGSTDKEKLEKLINTLGATDNSQILSPKTKEALSGGNDIQPLAKVVNEITNEMNKNSKAAYSEEINSISESTLQLIETCISNIEIWEDILSTDYQELDNFSVTHSEMWELNESVEEVSRQFEDWYSTFDRYGSEILRNKRKKSNLTKKERRFNNSFNGCPNCKDQGVLEISSDLADDETEGFITRLECINCEVLLESDHGLKKWTLKEGPEHLEGETLAIDGWKQIALSDSKDKPDIERIRKDIEGKSKAFKIGLLVVGGLWSLFGLLFVIIDFIHISWVLGIPIWGYFGVFELRRRGFSI